MKTVILILLSLLTINIFPQTAAIKPNLKDYEGIYELNDKKSAVIIVDGNKLAATVTNGSEFKLEYVKGDEFEIKSESTRVVFVRNADGKVIKLISYENDKIFEAKKIEPVQKVNKETDLKEYTGEYIAEEKEEPLIVSEEGGKLFATAGLNGKYELKRLKGDDFEIPEVSVGITFTRNKEKEIDGIKVINTGGQEIIGKKLKTDKK